MARDFVEISKYNDETEITLVADVAMRLVPPDKHRRWLVVWEVSDEDAVFAVLSKPSNTGVPAARRKVTPPLPIDVRNWDQIYVITDTEGLRVNLEFTESSEDREIKHRRNCDGGK